jgi:predicted AlkP superfamily phosphohydrolase/phosphomutase
VLVLGIDAANPELLERWAREGTLPTLQKLFGRAAVASTRGIEGFFIGSTWPSFSTGVNPARHGVHYLAQLRSGSYDYERIAERPEAAEPFWATAGRAGRRVAVLDVPLSRLAPELNGVQTVEWGGHDSLYGFRAHPAGLRRQIESEFGLHPQPGSCDGVRRTARDYEVFVDRLVRGATLKGRLTRTLLARGGWDLFVQVFTEAHCAGHQCWHLHDVAHPSHDVRLAAAVGDPLLRVYQAIDSAIGEILAEADDALVLLVVAHGMSHQYGAQFLLPEILGRLRVASPPPPGPDPGLARAAVRLLRRRLPPGLRDRLAPVVHRVRPGPASDGLPRLSVDPEHSLCFPVSNGLPVGGIRLNLRGREPAGRLEPGAEADRFSDRLAADLLAIRNLDTNRPLIRRVARTRELYRGDRIDELPDLLVEWADDGPLANTSTGPASAAVVRAASDEIGLLEGVNGWGRTGEHRPGGLIAAAGTGIAPAHLGEIDLLDVAPTILSLVGIEPRGLDGEPVRPIVAAAEGSPIPEKP